MQVLELGEQGPLDFFLLVFGCSPHDPVTVNQENQKREETTLLYSCCYGKGFWQLAPADDMAIKSWFMLFIKFMIFEGRP